MCFFSVFFADLFKENAEFCRIPRNFAEFFAESLNPNRLNPNQFAEICFSFFSEFCGCLRNFADFCGFLRIVYGILRNFADFLRNFAEFC